MREHGHNNTCKGRGEKLDARHVSFGNWSSIFPAKLQGAAIPKNIAWKGYGDYQNKFAALRCSTQGLNDGARAYQEPKGDIQGGATIQRGGLPLAGKAKKNIKGAAKVEQLFEWPGIVESLLLIWVLSILFFDGMPTIESNNFKGRAAIKAEVPEQPEMWSTEDALSFGIISSMEASRKEVIKAESTVIEASKKPVKESRLLIKPRFGEIDTIY